jgi:hypothetical protein
MGAFTKRGKRGLECARLRGADSIKRVGVLLPKWNMRIKALKAARRRLSESRMRENLTSGSRRQGMETWIR